MLKFISEYVTPEERSIYLSIIFRQCLLCEFNICLLTQAWNI